ncbi:LPS export ABC transporter periplasmic protein LptC [Planctobacterium marinum]|uniref:Lipopolysaccharide export system protein LptC n=1 Tax=Planctobacterium marinum TaxID=1631968 RepID=A0AA48HH31_9ALTE|nr:lipopolysaccharide export system protein LptC [Planctobacterium marinum]
MSRIHFSIGLLFLVLITIYFNMVATNDAPQVTDERPEAWDPNYQARNMKSTLYNESGSVNHEVFAASMEHYEILGFTLFEEPEYTIYTDETDSPWQIVAKEGTLYSDQRIELEQNVVIKSLNEQDFVQTIETSFVEIDLGKNTARSDNPVIITGQDFVIKSNGLSVNLLTRKLELKEHVETIYQQTVVN